MRVLLVTPRYYPYIGGVENVVRSIAERLEEPIILCGDPNISRVKEEVINKVRIYRWPVWSPSNTYHIPKRLNKLKEFFKNIIKFVDIIHIHNAHAVFSVYAGLQIKKMCERKSLIFSPYYHGRGHTLLTNVLWKLYSHFVKELIKKSSHIIVNSEYQKTIILNKFRNIDKKKLSVIYDGIDIENIKRAPPVSSLKQDPNEKVILCVNRLVPYKNIHLAIKALSFLPSSFKLLVVGEGDKKYREYLLNLASRIGANDRVRLLGRLPDFTVWGLYKTSDVFVHLSEIESFGMTCLEALAAGTPVVVNNDSGGLLETAKLFPEYINIFNKNKDSIKDLAEMIKSTMELKPVKVDLSQFSWDNIVKQVVRIYQNC